LSTSGRAGAAASIALVLSCVACSDDDAPDQFIQCSSAEPAASRVTIVGDSLTVQSQIELRDAVDGALVDACNGRTITGPIATDDALGRIEPLQASAPDWWVVALGTNDAAYGGRTPQVVGVSARQLLDAIGAEACVAWVLPAVQAPVTQAAIDNVVAAQQAITAELDRQDCHEVVDWPGAVAEDAQLLLDVDGIHLSEDGRQRFAELVADAIGD
jgi:lysophospholipase L1-like esterase